jgi:hypothetical protein
MALIIIKIIEFPTISKFTGKKPGIERKIGYYCLK